MIAQSRGLRPFLLVHPDALPDFDGLDTTAPHNAVIVGDAAEAFTFHNMNLAFRVLTKVDLSNQQWADCDYCCSAAQ